MSERRAAAMLMRTAAQKAIEAQTAAEAMAALETALHCAGKLPLLLVTDDQMLDRAVDNAARLVDGR